VTQPTSYAVRPLPPPPGSPAPELLVARLRGHARRLFWSAIVLIALSGGTAYLYDNLPTPFENWMLLAAAGVVALLLVVIPFLVWAARVYTITTRRVIVRRGVLVRRRSELPHARGYQITLRRGPLQRLWGCGTLRLDNGVDDALLLVNVPNVSLVHEVLVDQVEVSQILAHRDAQATPPPVPPLPA